MRRTNARLALAVSTGGVLAAIWIGCTGDPPPDATDPGTRRPGELGAACFPNRTCNLGLRCQAELCVPLTDAPIGTTTSSSSSGMTTSSSSSGVIDPQDASEGSVCTGTITATNGAKCPGVAAGACAPNIPCCANKSAGGASMCAQAQGFDAGGDGGVSCSTSAYESWACTATAQCGSARCCMPKLILQAQTCPPTGTGGGSVCQPSLCTTGQSQLCHTNVECPGGRCVPVLAKMGAAPVQLGYCVPL